MIIRVKVFKFLQIKITKNDNDQNKEVQDNYEEIKNALNQEIKGKVIMKKSPIPRINRVLDFFIIVLDFFIQVFVIFLHYRFVLTSFLIELL